MSDRLQSKYSGCCSDDCAILDKDCVCGWSSLNVICIGVLVVIDAVVVIGFYASNSIWNYPALCWIMFSTHAMATAMILPMWLPYTNRCAGKKDYDAIPTTVQ